MEFDELKLEYQKLKNGFKLFENITEHEDDMDLNIDLIEIEKIINESLPDILFESTPLNFYDLYFSFKYEFNKFKDFIMYDKLRDKKIIAIGGSSNSKKSSFLNFLLENQTFSLKSNPENLTSTYIINGEDIEIHGLDTSYSKVKINLSNLKSFSKLYGENEENVLSSLGLQDVFKSVLISTPIQVYKNIAFLNTSLNKSYNVYYHKKFYEKVAMARLNSSNYVIWFVQSSSIDVVDEDINFINKLRKETPKLIILNNDDDCTKEEINKIINKIKNMLNFKGIEYLDVLSYSNKMPDEFDNSKIKEYIVNWNDEIYESKFTYNFKLLFVKCMEYYKCVIENESKRLNKLNNLLSLSDNVNIKEYLFLLSKESEKNINDLKRRILNLRKIEDEFFMRIGNVADNFDIIMPEIDMIEDKVIDPLKVVKEYMKNHVAKSDPAINIMISDTLKDVNPVMNKELGGFEYKTELFNMTRKILVLKKDEVRFNEPNDNISKFIESINKL